jgi:hypothetical protein
MVPKEATMPNQTHGNRIRPLASASLALFAAACSGEVIDLGENTSSLEALAQSCPAPGPILARNQADIDALAGCEVLDGSLSVEPFEGADLRPLGSLREVRGPLELGDVEGLGADLAEIDALFQLLDERWLFSLEGLENLERVGALAINGFAVDSLEPLSGLQVLTGNGSLELVNCNGLSNLEGLENLVGLQNLGVSCSGLVSLSGLPFPDTLDNLALAAPDLKDLGELDAFDIGVVLIESSGLENLDGLASLISSTFIDIARNPELVDLDALDNLQTTQALIVRENPALERLPDFAAAAIIDELIIADNPLLQNVPTFPTIQTNREVLEASFELSRRDELAFRPDNIEIRGNASLEQIVLAPGWPAAGLITIEANPALESISFSDIFAVDFLSIANNGALEDIDFGALTRVDDLVVSGNPGLDLSVFDTLQTFSSNLSVAPVEAP